MDFKYVHKNITYYFSYFKSMPDKIHIDICINNYSDIQGGWYQVINLKQFIPVEVYNYYNRIIKLKAFA